MQAGGRGTCGTYLTVGRACRKALALQGRLSGNARRRQHFQLSKQADGTYLVRSAFCGNKVLSFAADCSKTDARLLAPASGLNHWAVKAAPR